jgi:hypothetical protein
LKTSRARGARVAALIIGMAALVAAGLPSPAPAQTTPAPTLHWALSSYFGTGQYSVEGSDTTVLRASPGWRIRESALTPGRSRTIGWRLRVPIAIGFQEFDIGDPNGALQSDNLSTLSVVPGFEFDIPLNERWSLKPLAYLGRGEQLDGGESATIYWAGLKSRRSFHAAAFDWSLINALTWVGYDGGGGDSGELLGLQAAFEFARSLGERKLMDHPVVLYWHASYTAFLDKLRIGSPASPTPVLVSDEWELGAAFGLRDHRLGVKRLRFDRLGLAYRFSTSGRFQGVSLTFSSLFDR